MRIGVRELRIHRLALVRWKLSRVKLLGRLLAGIAVGMPGIPRQQNSEYAATIDLARYCNPTAVQEDQVADNGKTQARPGFARGGLGFRLPKLIENVRPTLLSKFQVLYPLY